MPVEIKELIIKASVSEKKSGDSKAKEFSHQEKEQMKKEIIRECLEEIFQKLEEKTER